MNLSKEESLSHENSHLLNKLNSTLVAVSHFAP